MQKLSNMQKRIMNVYQILSTISCGIVSDANNIKYVLGSKQSFLFVLEEILHFLLTFSKLVIKERA